MKLNLLIIYIIYCILLHAHGQDDEEVEPPPSSTTVQPPNDEDIDEEQPELIEIDTTAKYCYRFTWLGPAFEPTEMDLNATCGSLMDSKRTLKDVPCSPPLVVTTDGTPPDLEYLWKNYKRSVLCKMTKGQVCARYSYYFNNAVQNVTYMCTKVFALNEGPVTNGCYKQTVRGDVVELCVCEQQNTGDFKPCNRAIRHLTSSLLLITLINKLL